MGIDVLEWLVVIDVDGRLCMNGDHDCLIITFNTVQLDADVYQG